MSKKLPAVTDREVIKVAKKLGFTFYRQAKGSHEVWRRVSGGRHTVIPRHAGKIIKRKTLKSIIEDLGITVEEFNELRR
jgi:predicted RNA binding protein YcfA (HicA-like mRNA interferase family)